MTTYLYAVDFEQGLPVSNYVHGTITTDCTNCVVGASDLLDWNLTLNVPGATEILDSGNSVVRISNINHLIATPTNLLWQFYPSSMDPFWFMNLSDGSVFELGSMPQVIAWQIGTTEITLVPTTDLIATAVPEPATWALLLLGFAAVAFAKKVAAKMSRSVDNSH